MTDRITAGVEVDLAAGLILIELDAVIASVGDPVDLPGRYSVAHAILQGIRRWKDDHSIPVRPLDARCITSGGFHRAD